MNAHRNAWIDAARGSAAVAVTLFHFNDVVVSGADRWREVWSYGHLGVPVFFVLSGWCITASWLKTSDWRDFTARRLRRIIPAYLASVALMILLAGITKVVTGVNDVTHLPTNWKAILTTLTLTTAPLTSVRPIIGVYWTLTYEMAYYSLLALLLVLPVRLHPGSLTALHVGLCAWVIFAPPAEVGPTFFVGLWPVFGLGCALAVRSVNPACGLAMLAASAAHVISVCWTGQHVDYVAAALLTAAGLIVAHHLAFPRLLRPLRFLGEISYSLYLVHIPLGYFVILRLFPLRTDNAGVYVLWQSLQLAAVVGLTWIFHLAFELRFLRPARLRAPAV